MFRALLALWLISLIAPAQATCLFAQDSKPRDWYEWANVLIAGEVTAIEARGQVDIVSLRVVETFKGPEGVETASLQVPNNLWEACRLERPAVGARVLGALNANSDALLVPLSASYAEQLRTVKPKSAPAPTSK